MGRWSQQRRRGGGPGAAAAPPATINLTTAHDYGGGLLGLTFDAPVTADPGATPEVGSLQINASPATVSTVSNFAPNAILVTQSVDPSAGQTASWGLQPPWIVEPINILSSALIS